MLSTSLEPETGGSGGDAWSFKVGGFVMGQQIVRRGLSLVGPLQLGSGAWPHALLRTARLEPTPSLPPPQIRSTSVTDARCEDKAVTHCQGRVLRPGCSLFDEQGQLCVAPSMPAAKELRLKDIGREGRDAETHARFFIGWSRRRSVMRHEDGSKGGASW